MATSPYVEAALGADLMPAHVSETSHGHCALIRFKLGEELDAADAISSNISKCGRAIHQTMAALVFVFPFPTASPVLVVDA